MSCDLQPTGFRTFFQNALDSGGALLATDLATGGVIGSSRYHGYHREMKDLMLQHAFRWVGHVAFIIDPANVRSQRAASKIGATRIADRREPSGRVVWVFQIAARNWESLPNKTAAVSAGRSESRDKTCTASRAGSRGRAPRRTIDLSDRGAANPLPLEGRSFAETRECA